MEEPIDLAHKTAEKGNPWFGMGNVLQTSEENGQGHGVYHHVFTPPDMTMKDVTTLLERIDTEEEQRGVLPLANIQALQEQMFSMARAEPTFLLRPKYMHWFHRIHAQGQRYARWQKIRKRQRRAAQRRHARGER